MTINELIQQLYALPGDAEVLCGSSDATNPTQFVWRREPRVVEAPKRLKVAVSKAIFIEGIGEVVAVASKRPPRGEEPMPDPDQGFDNPMAMPEPNFRVNEELEPLQLPPGWVQAAGRARIR
jgi:hypothetical protein